jgi:hypothetical protein
LQVWVWVAGQEAVGSGIVDERIIGQPLDGAVQDAGITEGVPRGLQLRMSLVEHILEPAECTPPWMARASRRPVRSSVIASAKSAKS